MKHLLLFTALVFLSALPASAAEKFLNIQEVRSKSGITAWLVEDRSLPIISMQFFFRDAGAAHDPAALQGLSQMLSNTLDEGAGDMDSQSFQKTLSDHSITLRFNSGRDGFGGQLKTLTRTREKAFELLSLALTQPRLDAEAVERMRHANLSRIRSSLSDPEWEAARLMYDRAYAGHPYALNSGGTLSTLAAIMPEDLRSIIPARLTRDRLFVAVAGDMDVQTLTAALDQVFGALPASSPLLVIPEGSLQNQGSITVYDQDIPQTLIEVRVPAFGREDPDFYALQVMNHIFGGGGFGSYLMEEAREKRGLTYGIYSFISDTLKIDDLGISTSTKNETAGEILDIIKSQMKRMADAPVDAKTLQDAQSYITGSLPLSLSSTDQISGMVLSLNTQDLPIDYLDTYRQKINAVTVQDVQRVAGRVLNPDSMTVVMVGKPAGVIPTQTVTVLPNVE